MNNKNKLGILVCLIGLMSVLLAHAQSAFKADGLVESTAGGFMFPDGSVQTTSAVSGGPYAIGGPGPGGGFVYLVTADGLHGMEAAPGDSGLATGVAWGCQGTGVGAYAQGIGSGARNTDAILRGCGESGIAAALADQYVDPQTAYFDWHLPTKTDLNLMYLLLHNQGLGNFCVGGIDPCVYWSSSENDNVNLAWAQNFSSVAQSPAGKALTFRARAVRAF